jgi:Arf-GAP/coiled-coil/ANK repeat/PH domain-containing protein
VSTILQRMSQIHWGLGEAYDGDIAFASALETFGGGHDDPISVAVGGFPLAACFSLSYLPTCAYADPCIFISLLITTCDCTGPVMTKFTIALREIGTYKEVLRSQVEHMLNDRLTQFVSIDLQDVKNVKEVRKRFDKASLHYDQVSWRALDENTVLFL